MKSEINLKNEEVKKEYPCLMEGSSGVIVLFEKKSCGMVLISDGHYYRVGDYSNSWEDELFKTIPKGSTVTLTQE